jgi:hypothetical protein
MFIVMKFIKIIIKVTESAEIKSNPSKIIVNESPKPNQTKSSRNPAEIQAKIQPKA